MDGLILGVEEGGGGALTSTSRLDDGNGLLYGAPV